VTCAETVLIVDDDPAVGRVLKALLEQDGVEAVAVRSGAEALALLERRALEAVVTDLRMPGMDGMELLAAIKRQWPDLPVLMLTAHASVPLAVEAMRRGAAGFLHKPFDRPEILYEIRRVLEASRGHAATAPAAPTSSEQGGLLGASPAMAEVQRLIDRAAATSANVLIRGESGTGKELVVRAIHERSPRRAAPLITAHCAAIPDALIEDDLFGHEKGAFTGATSRKDGRLQLADGGTLFLDEIGEVPPTVQVKLLRVLQERQFERVGGTATITVDLRLAAATHRDLEGLVAAGQFREDLFYRLNVLPIWLPPLRERGDDVVLLARHFCAIFGAARGAPELELDPSVLALLRQQPWPGNVRELQNFIERLVVLSDSPRITVADAQRALAPRPVAAAALASAPAFVPAAAAVPTAAPGRTLEAARDEAEARYLREVLQLCGDNRTQAARISGVSRRTFYNLLARHGLV